MSIPKRPGRSGFLLAALVLIFIVVILLPVPSVIPLSLQASAVQDLWIDLRMGPPLIPIYNEVAREDDIARVDDPSQIGQLRATTTGRNMIVFKSIREAAEALPEIASEIDIIGYNFETQSATPASELADPLDSIKAMRELADMYGLELAFGPDHDMALSRGAEIAPFADIFVLQIQRQQTNPQTVEEFVRPIVPLLRAANPDLEISVQVRTEGDVQQIIDLVDSLKTDLDGVSILTSPDSVETAEALIQGLRADESVILQLLRKNPLALVLALVVIIVIAITLVNASMKKEE